MAKISIFLVAILVSIFALTVVVNAAEEEKKAHFQRKKLGEQTRHFKNEEDTVNGIDHGPEYKPKQHEEEGTITKKQMTLGHKGEHWEPKKNDLNKKRKNHQKVRPESSSSSDDADLKLQDLTYEEAEQTPKRERKQRPRQRVEGKEMPEKVRQQKEQQGHSKKAVHKDMRKAIKKEIKQAMEQGMTPEKIYAKFAAEQRYPKKIYTKVLQKYVDVNPPRRGGSENLPSPLP